MKLMSAILVIAALLLPQWDGFRKFSARRRRGRSALHAAAEATLTKDANIDGKKVS